MDNINRLEDINDENLIKVYDGVNDRDRSTVSANLTDRICKIISDSTSTNKEEFKRIAMIDFFSQTVSNNFSNKLTVVQKDRIKAAINQKLERINDREHANDVDFRPVEENSNAYQQENNNYFNQIDKAIEIGYDPLEIQKMINEAYDGKKIIKEQYDILYSKLSEKLQERQESSNQQSTEHNETFEQVNQEKQQENNNYFNQIDKAIEVGYDPLEIQKMINEAYDGKKITKEQYDILYSKLSEKLQERQESSNQQSTEHNETFEQVNQEKQQENNNYFNQIDKAIEVGYDPLEIQKMINEAYDGKKITKEQYDILYSKLSEKLQEKRENSNKQSTEHNETFVQINQAIEKELMLPEKIQEMIQDALDKKIISSEEATELYKRLKKKMKDDDIIESISNSVGNQVEGNQPKEREITKIENRINELQKLGIVQNSQELDENIKKILGEIEELQKEKQKKLVDDDKNIENLNRQIEAQKQEIEKAKLDLERLQTQPEISFDVPKLDEKIKNLNFENLSAKEIDQALEKYYDYEYLKELSSEQLIKIIPKLKQLYLDSMNDAYESDNLDLYLGKGKGAEAQIHANRLNSCEDALKAKYIEVSQLPQLREKLKELEEKYNQEFPSYSDAIKKGEDAKAAQEKI